MNRLFSVVIPTYNRCHVLRKTLNALFNQTLEPALFEVIVVDDGSTDGTPQFVRPLVESAPVSLRYEWWENSGPGAARNRGIEIARGEHVLFIDDDIIADRMLLQEHLRYHRLHPGLNEAVLGQVTLAPGVPDTYLNRSHALYKWEEIADCHLVNWTHFMTGNISLKRHFLLNARLFFDEELLNYEDAELGYRAAQHGLRIFYNKQAIGYHHHDLSRDQLMERARRYGRNRAVLHRKHPELASCFGKGSAFSRRNLPSRIAKDLINPFVRNRLTMPLLYFLAGAVEGCNQALAALCYRQISAYYERLGYREGQGEMT